MGNQEFAKFLRSREEDRPDKEGIATRRSQWLQKLELLYNQVETEWLAEYIQESRVSCERVERVLDEERYGRYAVTALRITFQGFEVWLEPVGCNIIGAYGRVDLASFADRLRLVLVSPDSEGPRVLFRHVDRGVSGELETGRAALEVGSPGTSVWKLPTPPPAMRYLDLDKDLFLDALMHVVGAKSLWEGE